jgi:hypothetical protein
MQIKRFILIIIFLIGSGLVWTSSLIAQNEEEDPVNVGLLSFTAAVQADGVRLDWETATELNTAGFFIHRSSDGTNFAVIAEIGFVDSIGGVATGATYSEVDTTAVIGETYTYKLVELETDSSQHDLDTVTITFNPAPTATSIIIGGDDPTPKPTNTPQPTSTTAAAATATATERATAVSGTNNQPTTTPTVTATPQPTLTRASSSGSTINSQPTATPQGSTASPGIIDQAFNGSGSSGVALAQEEPTSEAYPAPGETEPDAPIDADTSYPSEQPETEIAPPNPTPYPANSDVDAPPTITIIGSDDPYPPEADGSLPTLSSDAIRGRIFLWAGFLIALFIFMSGVIGAIVLYRRRPA